ncbi:MAG: hypothetical protein Q8R00_00135 [Candidatus Nanoarchaeia archaeon]|nr:hypothetical protein [Candidatus Nanoarchaeia archaeon]
MTQNYKPQEKETHQTFVRSLSEEDKMMIALRNDIYFGSWERMRFDLRDRLKTRPYIFKSNKTIEEDLIKIERLQVYELNHKVNLSDLIYQEAAKSL